MGQAAVPKGPSADGIGSWLRRRRPAEWIGVLVIGAATGFLVFSFFAFRVCEDRINDAGTRQTVCRHVVLTDPPHRRGRPRHGGCARHLLLRSLRVRLHAQVTGGPGGASWGGSGAEGRLRGGPRTFSNVGGVGGQAAGPRSAARRCDVPPGS